MGQCTNRQTEQTFTMDAALETWVVGGVTGDECDFVLNGGTLIFVNIDTTALAGVTTMRIYTKMTPTDPAALLGTFAVPAGSQQSIPTQPSFGPIAAWAVQITVENAIGGTFDVSARVE